MKQTVLAFAFLVAAPCAHALACWAEWEYGGEMLVHAASCSENVSLPDFERSPLCTPRVRDDLDRGPCRR